MRFRLCPLQSFKITRLRGMLSFIHCTRTIVRRAAPLYVAFTHPVPRCSLRLPRAFQGSTMSVPTEGWSNSVGTADKSCKCGTWKDHWLNHADKSWPSNCSLSSCSSSPTLGGHVKNSAVTSVRIVPMCDSCNGLSGTFSLRGAVSIPEANKASCN